ncbi:unnamed protein product [Owenia fusiformis]|uniref:Uncharacterized protein n=1 Tax=Owenia fusiformis TaxID=6347 RepID=A0A8J1XH84_OWEFU|nr:unnamed protein product [Owenia fusiformis]
MSNVRTSLDTMAFNPEFSPEASIYRLKPKPIYVGGHSLPTPRMSGYWQTAQDRERLPYVKRNKTIKYPQPQISINSPRHSDQKRLEKSFVELGITSNVVEKTSIGTMTFVSPTNPGLTPFRLGRDGTVARRSASKRVRFDPKPDVSTIINTATSSNSANEIVPRKGTSFKGSTKRKLRNTASPSPEPTAHSRSRFIRGILKNGSTPITRSKTTLGIDGIPEKRSTKDSVQRSTSFVINRKEITYKPSQKPINDTIIQGGTMKGFLSSDKANYDPDKDDIMDIYCSPEKANSILKWLDDVNDIQSTEGRCTDIDNPFSMEANMDNKSEATCEIVYERGSEPLNGKSKNDKTQGDIKDDNLKSDAKLHNEPGDNVKDMDTNNNECKEDEELPTSVEADKKDFNMKTVDSNVRTNDRDNSMDVIRNRGGENETNNDIKNIS